MCVVRTKVGKSGDLTGEGSPLSENKVRRSHALSGDTWAREGLCSCGQQRENFSSVRISREGSQRC